MSSKVRLIDRGGAGYPECLQELPLPPQRLYALGNVDVLQGAPDRLVAIVGTRDASSYGGRVAQDLARAFVQAGVAVVSGLARGIDAAAHRGALEAGGATIAVLGTGIDVPYPVSHRGLHGAIAEQGLVVSENGPGVSAGPGCFPKRNRIIAALARVTIVVEAPYKSGAMNTATQALDLGRVVAAVPGPIDSSRSAGCNLLLRDGAHVIATIDDALGLLGVSRSRTSSAVKMSDRDEKLLAAISGGERFIEEIAQKAGLSIRQCMEGLSDLEMGGVIHRAPDGEVSAAVVI